MVLALDSWAGKLLSTCGSYIAGNERKTAPRNMLNRLATGMFSSGMKGGGYAQPIFPTLSFPELFRRYFPSVTPRLLPTR